MAEKFLVEDQIASNQRKTILVVGFMFMILFAIIFTLSYLWGFSIIFSAGLGMIFSIIYIWITYQFSVAEILSATGARPINKKVREEKILDYTVEELAIAAGLPKPKVYVQNSEDINAFATGKKYEDSIVCVTTGALRNLNKEELEGVISHELSHIKNRDILLATIVIGVVGSIAIISEILLRSFFWGGGRDNDNKNGYLILIGILFAILAPIFAKLTQLAISRRREYLADASGANLTKNPEGLASALEKIKSIKPNHPKLSKTVAPLYISNPFERVKVNSLFSTHPPLDERIKKLRQM